MTGTPAGVGAFRKPPLWMKHGDVCEVEVEKSVVAEPGEAEKLRSAQWPITRPSPYLSPINWGEGDEQ